jgi:uncharacterized protein YihD (DUF1040 family)
MRRGFQGRCGSPRCKKVQNLADVLRSAWSEDRTVYLFALARG